MKKKYRRAVCKALLVITTPIAAITYFMALPAIGINDLRIWLKSKLKVYDNDPD